MDKKKIVGGHLIEHFAPERRLWWDVALPLSRRADLERHYRWLRTGGRLGRQFEIKSQAKVFLQRDLDGACFEKAKIQRSPFIWCSLRLVTFADAALDEVIFKSCELGGADFRGARLNDVKFIDCFNIDTARFDESQHPVIEQTPSAEGVNFFERFSLPGRPLLNESPETEQAPPSPAMEQS